MNKIFTSHRALFIFFGFILSCTFEQDRKPGSLLGLGFGINSASIFVQDLDSTRNYYAEVLGFKMPLPEKYEAGIFEGTLRVAAHFPDLATLELLAVKDTSLVSAKYSFITSFLKHHEGVRLYSLSTSSADTTHNWLSSQGFRMDSLRSGRSSAELPTGWNWDDGGPEWRSVAFSSENPSAYLPNFKESIDFPYQEIQNDWKYLTSMRKYEFYSHPNGVVGIAALRIVVDDLKAARKEFKKIGLIELEVNDSLARFRIAHNQELELIAPQSPDDELSDFLKTQGSGVYALRFKVKKIKETEEFLKKKLPAKALRMEASGQRLTVLKEYAHGVQLEFIEESKEQAALARIYSFKKDTKLDTASLRYASDMYAKYCALCHGKDREGYAADFAPSLRSHSLMATTQSSNYLRHAVSYGRQGTAMAGYAKNQGGPLGEDDIDLLLQWLYELSGVEKPVEMSTESVTGNIALGKKLYAKYCAACHGTKGEGVRAPALGNPMLLATASDEFLRYAISEGRDGTPMPSFKDSLSNVEIDALTAYIRSRSSGWNAPEAVTVTEPLPENYVLNPHNKAPAFILREERYVSAEQLLKALQDSLRIILLDARSKAAWHQAHIPGAISVPYYDEPDSLVKHIPKDSTWIVAYCACPHAASQRVVNTLKRFGYKNTAILDEGVLVWTQRGYPVQYGQDNAKKKK